MTDIPQISFREDDWLLERKEQETRWIVDLSDGSTVFQDDDRPNVEPSSAWVRLKEYCERFKLYVKSMRLQFRSHTEHIGNDKDAFFFRKGVLAALFSNVNTYYYVAGHVENGMVHVKKWKTPELVVVGNDVREISKCEDSLIWRPNVAGKEI